MKGLFVKACGRDRWIKISEINPALALSNEKSILIYTPCYDDPKIMFRIILVDAVRKCSEATHWKQCTLPGGNKI